MTFKVCIPCAGTGSRLGDLTRYINKSLVSVSNKPAISHIIEKFPPDVEFVIALGYKGDLIKQYLKIAHPLLKVQYVNVYPYEGAGSGLAFTLYCCEKYLQGPFIFVSCDTMVVQTIPPPTENWMGYATLNNQNEGYRSLSVINGCVKEILEKGQLKGCAQNAYIGLAGIKEYNKFWKAITSNLENFSDMGEVIGLSALIDEGISANEFLWHDTGNLDSLKKARDFYKKENEPNILDKGNEAIWFIGSKVVKYSHDEEFIKKRVSRSKILEGFVPKISNYSRNMYSYEKVDGEVLSKVVTLPLFDRLLKYSIKFWNIQDLNSEEIDKFTKECFRFYKEKTYDRIDLFYKNFNYQDTPILINGQIIPQLKSVLDGLDWDWLTTGLPGRFHGDFHFENIIWDNNKENFIFIDWRQDFGGEDTIGDIYYDVAKLCHGLIINHNVIVNELYSIEWTEDEIRFDFFRKNILIECEEYLKNWMKINSIDENKVYILTALIFLNIAALHHYPYSLLLFALGRKMLYEYVSKKECNKENFNS